MTRNYSRAIAYSRTSSATNVEGDSEQRQLDAINSYAERAGLKIVAALYDPAISGKDSIEARPGFAEVLALLESSDAGVVIVESADRFARKLAIQEAGIAALAALGVKLVTASGDDLTDSDDDTRVMIRQILGSVSQFESAKIKRRLKSGRDRVRAAQGYCEGPRPAPLAARAMAKELRSDPHAPLSLRAIARRLAEAGHLNPRGEIYKAESIRCMLD